VKYKVIGWLDLILGGLGCGQQVIMLFLVYPKLEYLYQGMEVELPFITRAYPYLTGAGVLFLAGTGLLGAKLVFGSEPGEKLYKLGVALFAGLLILGGLYFSATLRSLIEPLYTL
jgi:hypothetical protein